MEREPNPGKKHLLGGDYCKAKKYYDNALTVCQENGDQRGEALCYSKLGEVFDSLGEYGKAKEYFEKALVIVQNIGDQNGVGITYCNLGRAFHSLGEYGKCKEYNEKALAILQEIGDQNGVGATYDNLGVVFRSCGEYGKAKEYHEKALAIRQKIGDQKGVGATYSNLGTVCYSLSEYDKAKENYEKALAILQKTGDQMSIGANFSDLGQVFYSLGEYGKSKEYYEKALVIYLEFGNQNGEGACYIGLGQVFYSLGEYDKAKKYYEKALEIDQNIGAQKGVGVTCDNLGLLFYSRGEYDKAIEYHEKALEIKQKIGHPREVGVSYNNLGILFYSRGEYRKAKEYHEKALAIQQQIGDMRGVGASYGNLGVVFHLRGEIGKAKENLEKAIRISQEIGNQEGEAASYGNLGMVFYSLCEYDKAKESHEKALEIQQTIGNLEGVGVTYSNLGQLFYSLYEYDKAKEFYEEALAIMEKIGDQTGVGSTYCNLGRIFISRGEYGKAKEYLEKALAIQLKIGNQREVGVSYLYLGLMCDSLGQYDETKKYINKAIVISKEIGDQVLELDAQTNLSFMTTSEKGNTPTAISSFSASISKCEYIRNLMKDNDEFKVLFLDKYSFLYHTLSELHLAAGNSSESLRAVEIGRARALADLMSRQYAVENPLLSLQSSIDFERFISNEMGSLCLYISFSNEHIFLWILRANKTIEFRAINVKDIEGKIQKLEKFLSKGIIFRRFLISPKGQYENRYLCSESDIQLSPTTCEENSSSCFRLVELEDTEEEDQELYPSLSLYYKLIIAPVADLLAEESEIVIVPDRFLYSVPFAALLDESGVSLSDKFRIRMVPSLTTLRLIQNSPADYHSQTGALIVGDPEVGFVIYKGLLDKKPALPFARKEAEMIGRLIGAQPLIGEHATKDAVLQMISSVSLIHIAAHGNAERGEIALTPRRPTDGHPQEENYLLTMSDVSKVQLRAKLVVLSCCHSACGQIKSEGVVGIARAFLGSRARSVLVALWALPDESTEIFMRCFYKHLARGDSASECLHQAMKWMRNNGYPDVRDWAPFVLIGDDVSFDFAKLKVSFSET